jgi:hypothetical protein
MGDGVENCVQGHHHPAGLRRHRQRVLRYARAGLPPLISFMRRAWQVSDGMFCFASQVTRRTGTLHTLSGRRRRRRLFIAGWVGEKCVCFRFTNATWFWWFCSILYNRGVYPEESFTKVKKYGLTMLLTQDEGVKAFIASITSQLSGRRPPWDLSLPPSPQLDCLEAEKRSALLIGVVI